MAPSFLEAIPASDGGDSEAEAPQAQPRHAIAMHVSDEHDDARRASTKRASKGSTPYVVDFHAGTAAAEADGARDAGAEADGAAVTQVVRPAPRQVPSGATPGGSGEAAAGAAERRGSSASHLLESTV